MINSQSIAKMKRGAILVNPEPPGADHSLLRFSSAVITPPAFKKLPTACPKPARPESSSSPSTRSCMFNAGNDGFR
jgi:hypothetical protein